MNRACASELRNGRTPPGFQVWGFFSYSACRRDRLSAKYLLDDPPLVFSTPPRFRKQIEHILLRRDLQTACLPGLHQPGDPTQAARAAPELQGEAWQHPRADSARAPLDSAAILYVQAT